MRSLALAALAAAALSIAPASPAQAQELPAESAFLHLKDVPGLFLDWTDEGAKLTAEGDAWSFRSPEALVEVGETLIVHRESGQCLSESATLLGSGAGVELVDCADATVWSAVFDNVPAHMDWRFITPDGDRVLGIDEGAEAVEGVEVFAVSVDVLDTSHEQEWQFEAPADPTPSEEPSPQEDPSSAAPQLPQTGVGAGLWAWSGAAAAAVAAGLALTLWLRRRALRTQW